MPPRLTRLALLAALPLALLFAAPALAQPGTLDAPSKDPLVTVSGTATVYRTPDYVDVTFSVVVHKDKAVEAKDAALTTMAAVTKAIKDLKLKDEDLKTGSLNLTPEYRKTERYGQIVEPPEIVGYSSTVTLTVRTSDVTQGAAIVTAATAAGANRIDSVDFGLKEYLAAREEALGMAAKSARTKAAAMAKALDLRLDRVISIAERASYGGFYGNRYSNSNIMAQTASNEGGGAPSGDEGGGLSPGRVAVVVTVDVVFAGGKP